MDFSKFDYDFNEMKRNLDRLSNQENRKKTFWKPTEGKQIIRIVPWKDHPNKPFVELYFHYGIAGGTYLSPLSNGNPDPIVEFAEDLRSQGGDENYHMSKKFTPAKRTLVPVIVRGEESEGVRLYSFGKTVYKSLCTIMADEDYGNIIHPLTGRDITLTYTPKKDGGFPHTDILVKPVQTPLSDSEEEIMEWLKDQPSISDVYTELSYDELKEILYRHLNPEETNSQSDDGEESISQNKLSPELPEEEASTVDNTMDEFSKLFSV